MKARSGSVRPSQTRDGVVGQGPQLRRVLLQTVTFGAPIIILTGIANDPVNVPKLALLLAGVTIVAAIRLVEILHGASAAGLHRLVIPGALLAAPLLISWSFSPYREWALLGKYPRFQGLIPYILVIAFGTLVADAFAGKAVTLAWTMGAAGAVVGAYALVQVLGADFLSWAAYGQPANRPISTLGNTNFTGGFLAIVLPALIPLCLMERRRRRPARKMLLVVLLGLAVANSQGAWLAAMAGATVTSGLLFAERWRYARVAGIAVASAMALVALGTVVLGLTEMKAQVPRTAQSRALYWASAVRMSAASPVVGRGPNSFAVEGSRYRSAEDIRQNTQRADDPHSVPLAMLANAGILGLLGFLAIFVWFTRQVRVLPTANTTGIAFAGCAIAYFVQSLVSIDQLPLHLMLWVALGGLAASTQKDGDEATRQVRKPRAHTPGIPPVAAMTVTAVVTIGALWWTANFVLADIRVLSGTRALVAGNTQRGRADFDRALAFRNELSYRRQYGDYLSKAAAQQGDDGAGLARKARETLSYLVDFPDAAARAEYARFLRQRAPFEADSLQESARLWGLTVEAEPINPVYRLEAFDTLMSIGKPAEAADVAEAGAGHSGAAFDLLWGAVALARAKLGDYEGARSALIHAPTGDPRARAAAALIAASEQSS